MMLFLDRMAAKKAARAVMTVFTAASHSLRQATAVPKARLRAYTCLPMLASLENFLVILMGAVCSCPLRKVRSVTPSSRGSTPALKAVTTALVKASSSAVHLPRRRATATLGAVALLLPLIFLRAARDTEGRPVEVISPVW